MRLKILEALEHRKMMDDVGELIKKLWLKEKNVCYVVVKIISYLDVQDTFQKSVVVTINIINLKKWLFSFRTWSYVEIQTTFAFFFKTLWFAEMTTNSTFTASRHGISYLI